MTYAEFCKTECRWCERGWPLLYRPGASPLHHEPNSSNYPECTAPLLLGSDIVLVKRQKYQQCIDDLETALHQLRLDVEAAEHANGCNITLNKIWLNEKGVLPPPQGCNCFKARVLAGIDKIIVMRKGII